MNKKKILSLLLVCCMLVGMLPAALAEEVPQQTPSTEQADQMEETTPPVADTTEPSEEEPTTLAAPAGDAATISSETTTADGFHKFVSDQITVANNANGTKPYMQLALDKTTGTITVDFVQDKLTESLMFGNGTTSITGTGLIDLIYAVVQESNGCTLKVSGEKPDDPNALPPLEDVEITTSTTKDDLKNSVLMACMGMLGSDLASFGDIPIGALVGHKLTVDVKLKAASGASAPEPIKYTFDFTCTTNTAAAPAAPVFAADGASATIEEIKSSNGNTGMYAIYTLEGNVPANTLYRVYTSENGDSKPAGIFMAVGTLDGGNTNTNKLTLCFEKDAVPKETTKYYIAAEQFGKQNTTRTEITAIVPEAVHAPGFAISTSESILTKKASDLMLNAALTPDNTKDNTYLVTGTAKYVENWMEFDGTLHTGHYLALTVTKPDNLPANANYTVTAKGNQKITYDKDHFFTEGSSKDTETFVMYLDKLTDGKFTLAFDWDGSGAAEAVTYTFDVSGMSMPEKDAIVVAPPTVTGTKAEVKVTESDITDAIAAAVPTTSPAPGTALEPVIVIDSTKNDSGATITTATEAKVTLPKESVAALKTASDTENDLTVNIATPVGTIEVGKDVLAVLEAAASSEDINLNMEKVTSSLPADAEGDQVYEVNFQTASGAPVEVPSANLILTLRFSNITDPSAVKITSDKNSSERIVPERFTAVPGETNTYDFTFKVTHLTLFYATTATTPTPTTGTVTKTEGSDSNLGKTIKFTVAGAGSSITNAYLTVNAKRGSGTNAVNFCTVVPVTLTSGAGSDVAELYFQNDVTITGAWVTENKPTLTNGAPISGSILASLQP